MVFTKMLQMTTPSTGSVEKRQKRENTLIQIVLFSLFLLLNSTYGMYGPGYLFKGTTPLHHAFLIFIIFAFTGAYCALIIGDEPQFVKLQRFYSILSVVSVSLALSFLVTDLFLQYYAHLWQLRKQILEKGKATVYQIAIS